MNMPTREVTALNRAVAAQIRSVLTIRQMRQAALAKQMGVTEVWLSRRLREIQPLSLDDVEAICRALKVEPAELIARAVREEWLPTQGYFDVPDRPRSTRPSGGPPRSRSAGPPNVGHAVRRSRVTGTPLAVASTLQVASGSDHE